MLPPLEAGERAPWLAGALAVSAAVLLWPMATGSPTGGVPDIGASLEGWDAVARYGVGAGLTQAEFANYPVGTDVLARLGYPLEAALLWPLLAAVGLPTALKVGCWLWLWAAGGAAAWLGGRWWGSAKAGLVVGVGWQASWAAASPDRVLAAVFVPLALGGVLIALARPRWVTAGLAGLAAGLAGITWAPAGAVVGVGVLLALTVALAGKADWRAVWMAGMGAVIGALAVSVPVWGWTLAHRWMVPLAPAEDVKWPLVAGVVLAGVALRAARRGRRRVLLPALMVVVGVVVVGVTVGLGAPDPFRDIPRVDGSRGLLVLAELGLVLLAGGIGRGWWGVVGVLLVNGLVQSPRGVMDWPVVPEVSGPVVVVPWGPVDPAVRAALGVPVVNAPLGDPVGDWLVRRRPVLEELEGEAGRAALLELGVTGIVDVEAGTVTLLKP